MSDRNIILKTAYVSLFVQLFIGILGIHGILIPLEEEDYILKEIIIMETIVQFIELTFYIWLTIKLSKMSFDVTYTRYFDWSISTPIMLLSTIFLFEYINAKQNNEIARISNIINEDGNTIIKILISNVIMLLSGFLAEIKYIPRTPAFFIGTIAFVYTFYTIKKEFVNEHIFNNYIFYFMAFFWGLYGVAFLFDYGIKNVSYNFLDIFSKNFFELFTYIIILKTANYI